MRKVWQVRTTVVRGWRRRGNRNAYLRRICLIFLYLMFIQFYIISCGIIGLHWLDTSRVIDIFDNPSSIFFLTVCQTLRTRDIWIHFFFWDRQHRNKWSQKSKKGPKARQDLIVILPFINGKRPITKDRRLFNLAIQTYIFKHHIIYKFLRKPHHNSCCLYWAN